MEFERRDLDRSNQWGRILAILHFVLGGFVVLCACFPGVYVALGGAMMSGSLPSSPSNLTPEYIGAFFVGFGVLFGLILIVIGVLNVVAGVMIKKRNSWSTVLIVSCVNMINQPLGMLLGIFTLMWLMRPDVRESFAREGADGLDD